MNEADRDAWLTEEDVNWRPQIPHQPLNWGDLKRMWDYCYKSALSGDIFYDAFKELMKTAFSMLGRSAEPSTPITRRLFGIGSDYRDWRWELWYRMLYWEMTEWYGRIYHKAGMSHARAVNTIIRKMPEAPWPRLYGGHDHSEDELEIAWRWLWSRGRRLKPAQWHWFTTFYFAGFV